MVNDISVGSLFDTYMHEKGGRHFKDDIFKCVIDTKVCISAQMSPRFVPKDPITNRSALVP